MHNRLPFTEQFLTSVQSQDCSEPIEVTVVDDGSSDGTREFLESQSDIAIIQGSGSWWWAGCMNRALTSLNPKLKAGDFVYLGNNDTVLDPRHLSALLSEATSDRLVGSIAVEVWPDGTHYPVSGGFFIDPSALEVTNAGLKETTGVDGLAGRGLLLPFEAVTRIRLHPRAMPQHFADLAFTNALKRQGFTLIVEKEAVSTQLERAGSSVEFPPRRGDIASRRSQIYLPALWSFWWSVSSPAQRLTLPGRFARRGVRQLRSGAYV